MFTDFGGDLPLPTKIVLEMSNILRSFWWVAVLAIVGAVVGIKKWYATDIGQKRIDQFLLKMPVLGDVLLKGSVARFTRTLGTLISSGVPILSGLEITARTSGNRVISDAILQARAAIREGETVGAPLKASNVFPPMVVQMISVGEQTGALDEMLTKIAVFYEAEVDQAVENLTSVMYLPMFKLISVVSGE
jgi:type IV pilus assembly protein PilC